MNSFDSISKLTTLNKDLPLRRFKYSAAYFSTLILQMQIDKKSYEYSDLSYIPYSALPQAQKTLGPESNGILLGTELSAVYAVYYKTELVTYVEPKNGKINGIMSYYNQGGANYLHQFPMSNIDKDSSMNRLAASGALVIQTKSLPKEESLTIANDFIKFTHDSLLYSRDVKDVKNSRNNFFKFRQRLLSPDTLDFYTIHYSVEYLKEKICGIPTEEIALIPYSKLSKKQKQNLDPGNENLGEIFAVMHGKDLLTYLCLSGDKVKYFLAFKNLKGQYVFIPYGYANQIIRRS